MKTLTKVVTTVVLVGGVVGAVAAYNHGPLCGAWGSPEHRADHLVGHLADRLDLTGEQSARLDALKDQVLELRRSTHDERSQTRATALTLLDAPTLNQQQALALVSGKTERVNQLAPEVVATLAAFTDSLSAEQRAELKQMVTDRMQRHGHHASRETH